MTHVLIAGISTRAAAESAARAGFAVTAIDAFGDLDQHPAVRSFSLARDLGARVTAHAAARAARAIDCDAVAYLSSFENHPNAVKALAAGRMLWGNSPEVLRRVRDPQQVADIFLRRGSAVPKTFVEGPAEAGLHDFLLKPLASGGGQRVRPWTAGSRVPRGSYLQEQIDGVPGSIVFAAANGRTVPLGLSRQLVGDAAFGAAGYRYCGNILLAAGDDERAALFDAASSLAAIAAADFHLVGVNGIDFVARGRVPYPIEVNPRWSASMELVERAYGVSVFGVHAAACVDGGLPPFDLASARVRSPIVGKAVVFARHSVTVGDTRSWLSDPTIRDVPHPAERIARGRPVCTVFADGPDENACYRGLVARADRVYADLDGKSLVSTAVRRDNERRQGESE